MVTRVFLVRHGATVLTREDSFSGATDVALSDAGREQANRLGERLAEQQIDAAYCSNKSRAYDTCCLIAKRHGLEPIKREALREIDHGHWEGRRRKDVEVEFAEEYAQWEADPFVFAPEGGESGLGVLSRALPELRKIILEHQGKNVLIVSHKATIRLLLSSLLGFDLRGYRDRLDQAPACLNILDFKDASHARLTLFNDVSHYGDYPGHPPGSLSKWWDVK